MPCCLLSLHQILTFFPLHLPFSRKAAINSLCNGNASARTSTRYCHEDRRFQEKVFKDYVICIIFVCIFVFLFEFIL